MTTVADLVAKLGFKVDDSGFNKFKNSLQAFQSIVREGIKELKEYAKEAEKISRIMSRAYTPTKEEARERYLARTKQIKLNAESYKKRTDLLSSQLAIKKAQDETRNRALALSEKTSPQLLAIREATISFKQQYQPQILALKEAAQRLKDSKLILDRDKLEYQKQKDAKKDIEKSEKSKHGGIFTVLKNMAAFNVGGIAGGLASLAGASHPVVMAISLGVKAIVAAINLVMKTIRDGVRTAMGYRDYMAFTGRNTRGISGLMAASLNTTNLTPEDIMRDSASFDKQYWDMWFGGGNPRFWQMIGRLPTGRGEEDLQTILQSVYGLSGGLENKGLARSLLSQAGLSEEYITLLEDIAKNNPNMSPSDFFARSREEIASLEDGNKALRELDRSWKELKVELARVMLNSGVLDAIKTISVAVQKIADYYAKKEKPWYQDFFNRSGVFDVDKMVPALSVGGQTNLNVSQTNQVTVSSPDDAASFVNKTGADSISNLWWHRNNPAYRTAGATGGA